MARRQATTKKRRTSTRKKKPTVAAKRQMTGNVIGLIGLLVTILALLKVGLVGMVFAEFFRAIAGNAYQIFCRANTPRHGIFDDFWSVATTDLAVVGRW